MPTKLSIAFLLGGSALLLACGRPAADKPATDSVVHFDSAAPHASAHAADSDSAAHEPQALRPIMQKLAAEMAGLSAALWMEDYDQMAVRTAAISGHTDISADELRRIEQTLGKETAAFNAADERVHEAALRMHAAAQARQLDVFVQQFAEVQRGCVSCHTTFRHRLRTSP